jgi:hypothetical protein
MSAAHDLVAYTQVLGTPNLYALRPGAILKGWLFHWRGGFAGVTIWVNTDTDQVVQQCAGRYPDALGALTGVTQVFETFTRFKEPLNKEEQTDAAT